MQDVGEDVYDMCEKRLNYYWRIYYKMKLNTPLVYKYYVTCNPRN